MFTHDICIWQKKEIYLSGYPSYIELCILCEMYNSFRQGDNSCKNLGKFYFSDKIYLVGTHWNCLIEAIPVSVHLRDTQFGSYAFLKINIFIQY